MFLALALFYLNYISKVFIMTQLVLYILIISKIDVDEK